MTNVQINHQIPPFITTVIKALQGLMLWLSVRQPRLSD